MKVNGKQMDECFVCGKRCFLFGVSNMCWDCYCAKNYGKEKNEI